MSVCAASNIARVTTRVALTGLVGIWIAGCSSDATRLSDPFTNPFASASTESAAPTKHVASTPLNSTYAAAPHQSPVASSTLAPAPATTSSIRGTTTQPITGFGDGWSAAGGSPIIVADGETLDIISRRYGVPPSALLKVNGFSSAGQVHAGTRLVVPVYNNSGSKVADKSSHAAEAEESPRAKTHVADAETTSRSARTRQADAEDEPKSNHKRASEKEAAADDSDDAPKSKHAHSSEKDAKADDAPKSKHAHESEKDAKADDAPKSRHAREAEKDAKADDASKAKHAHGSEKDAKADAAQDGADKLKADRKSAEHATKAKDDKSAAATTKGQATANKDAASTKHPTSADMTPTATVHPQDSVATTPLTGQQADAAGVAPEFRWPARGRIIQGFKSGGNDGINIAVPEGTSVKAAESGVVAYAGSELKGYGNLVLIRHPNGYVTAYANNGELDVKRGDTVKRGQIIAKSGQSGNVSSPQLHFELRKGSTPVDPTNFLAGL
jgi:murein DD-endopeptidase MepM/ murein hydrolase activator NlpD